MQRRRGDEDARIGPLLAAAHADLGQGRAEAAEKTCHRVLRLAPAHPDALRLLGLAQLSKGQTEAAVTTLESARAADPENPEIHYARGLAFRRAGAVEDAIAAYRTVLERQTKHPEALNNLAGLLIECGAAEEAVAIAERAVAAAPGMAAAWNTLGNARVAHGAVEAAVADYRRAVALSPGFAHAHHNLGLVYSKLDNLDEAIARFRRAADATPPHLPALTRLGAALRTKGQLTEAVATLRRAVAAAPHDPAPRIELAHALGDSLGFEDAAACYRESLRLKPDDPVALNGLGYVLAWRKQFPAALEAYRAATSARPDIPAPRFGEGVVALLLGDFEAGFQLYENRPGAVALRDEAAQAPPPLLTPERLADFARSVETKTVLLFDEQGFGDTFLFARFLPLLAARGVRVVLQVRGPSLSLLREIEGVADAVGRDVDPPVCDARANIPSLGWVLGVTATSIADGSPYLHAPRPRAEMWRARLAGRAPLIAVAWAGNPLPRHRSIKLAAFAALFDVAGARFVSVQKDLSDDDRALLACHDVADLSADIVDFADTAAILEVADLVISIDTAVANLAGALARPTWVALGYLPDWRWGPTEPSTIWFPTATLFRQETPGDWSQVLSRMHAALVEWCRTNTTEWADA